MKAYKRVAREALREMYARAVDIADDVLYEVEVEGIMGCGE